uniref:TIR domain-containing protein n=1 Tax=Neogobius melanostomus TaxID=47308 RepID=A0A8C6TNY2_9GOBI
MLAALLHANASCDRRFVTSTEQSEQSVTKHQYELDLELTLCIIHGDQVVQEQTPQTPPLIEGELYHVFLSYSSTDSEWAESLMEELESRGLKVCCHLRDFTAGRSILENMSECIAQSQKVLLVLSPDFVNSRWCLMEANMSLFRDCLQMKTIPVLLRPVSIPPYLAHITYLEPQHPDFTLQLFRLSDTPPSAHCCGI